MHADKKYAEETIKQIALSQAETHYFDKSLNSSLLSLKKQIELLDYLTIDLESFLEDEDIEDEEVVSDRG